jgi:hypothetical protein
MTAIFNTTSDSRWSIVAATVGNQIGDIVNTETRDGKIFYNINFPKLPNGSGYGGLFLGVPSSVVTID